jgi:hypothetical protein
MVPLIPYTADELMAMDRDSLRSVRGEFFRRLTKEKKPMEVHQAILDVMVLFTMVQDIRDWSPLAEPGIAAMLLEMGEEWEGEIESAREIDRHSVDEHAELVQRFEEAGGREALDAALRRLNALAEP